MKSRMVKRILAMVMAVTFLAGDVLPITAADMENTPIVDEVKEEVSSLWEDVETPDEEDANTPAENNDEVEKTEEDGNEQTVQEGEELVTIEDGETALADKADDLLDEDAEEEEELEAVEGEEVKEEEAEEDDYVTIEPVTVDDVTITVKALKDVLPEGTYVEAIELDPIEVEEIITTITELENEETEENEEVVVKRYKAFDITLYVDKDGEKTEVQPDEGTVTVSFSGDMIVPESGEEVAIYHVDDNDNTDVEKMDDVAVTTDENDEQVVELEAEHFSKYVITYTYTSKKLDEWNNLDGDLLFRVLDDANQPIANARYVLYYTGDKKTPGYNFKAKGVYPELVLESDENGYIAFSIFDKHDRNQTGSYYGTSEYYWVLRQVASNENHPEISDVKILEEVTLEYEDYNDHGSRRRYHYTRKFTVDYGTGSKVFYPDGDAIDIRGARVDYSSSSSTVVDPGSLESASKEAALVDWENRVYKLDLNAVVGRTITNKAIAKVVVIADVSGSMVSVDARVVNPNEDRIYFSNTCDSGGNGKTVKGEAQKRLPSYRKTNGNNYIRPDGGYYYFYSGGSWYKSEIKNISDSNNCLNRSKATRVSDISGETLYTDRGDALQESLKAFVEGLPDGTGIEFIKFNGNSTDISNGFKIKGENGLDSYINGIVPKLGEGTVPVNALEDVLDKYYHSYDVNKDSYLVFFADGESSYSYQAEDESLYAEAIRATGVETYAVGFKTTSDGLIRIGGDNVYTCDDTESLINAMQGISSEIAVKTKGTLVDEIDPHFEVCTPSGSTDAAEVQAYYEGATITENAISWNGNAEFTVGGTTKHEVYIKAKDDFVGGNFVSTNGTLSITIGDRTRTAESPKVNVKGEVDANKQTVTITKGESLKADIEKHLNALEPAEGEKDLRFTSAVADSDYSDINIKFYKNKDYKGEFFTLEQMKNQRPEKNTTYYVLVEAVPKKNGNDPVEKSQVEEAMTQDGTYFYMDRELENKEREAVKKAEYVVKVESAELEINATKSADYVDWDARTYVVNLGANTTKKVTKSGEPNPVKVIFVLDTSRSMKGTKLSNLKKATKEFIDELDYDSQVAAFGFDGSGYPIIGSFKTLSSDEDKAVAKNAIDAISTGSGTHSEKGFGLAKQLLGSNKYDDTYLIFFTDGEDDDKTTAVTRAKDIRNNNGVPIYAIALGYKSDDFFKDVTGDLSKRLYCDDAASLASSFKTVGEEISDAQHVPVEAGNITLYDEISEYFDLIDSEGNILTSDAAVKAAYGANAELGSVNGKTTITFKNLSTSMNADSSAATVSKAIYLKAKPSFAGGNLVPTNGEYKVSAPDPNYPGTTREDSVTTSPTVNVKFEAEGDSDTEEIFLGETLGEYLTTARLTILKNKLYKDSYTSPVDYSFLNEKSDIEWFRKLNEDGTVSEPIVDITKEAPTKETIYYGKITISPKYTDETAEYKVENVEVIGTYKVTILEGQITVTKEIEDLNAAKALSYDGNPIFTFALKKKNSQGGYDTVQTKAIDFGNQYQTGTKSVTFEKLGKGEYVVEELGSAGWTVSEGYQQTSNAMSLNKTKKTGECTFKNKAVKQKAFADKDVVINSITKDENGKIVFTKKQENNGN